MDTQCRRIKNIDKPTATNKHTNTTHRLTSHRIQQESRKPIAQKLKTRHRPPNWRKINELHWRTRTQQKTGETQSPHPPNRKTKFYRRRRPLQQTNTETTPSKWLLQTYKRQDTSNRPNTSNRHHQKEKHRKTGKSNSSSKNANSKNGGKQKIQVQKSGFMYNFDGMWNYCLHDCEHGVPRWI